MWLSYACFKKFHVDNNTCLSTIYGVNKHNILFAFSQLPTSLKLSDKVGFATLRLVLYIKLICKTGDTHCVHNHSESRTAQFIQKMSKLVRLTIRPTNYIDLNLMDVGDCSTFDMFDLHSYFTRSCQSQQVELDFEGLLFWLVYELCGSQIASWIKTR